MLYPTTACPETGFWIAPVPQLKSTECGVAVGAKFTPLTFAFAMVTDWLDGLKVYPAKLGVRM
jgi:hypothetical protein